MVSLRLVCRANHTRQLNMKQPPITAFHWRQTPCLLLREFASPSAFIADPKKRGREKIVVDVAGMVQMRREGRGWRDIAQRFDCNKETARQRVGQVAPELVLPMRKRDSAAGLPCFSRTKGTEDREALR